MSIRITPCIKFHGNCAEAIKFYQRGLDGVLETKTTLGELTENQREQVRLFGFAMDDSNENIVWARLKICDGDHIELGDSNLSFDREHDGHALSLVVHNENDAKRWFDNLSEDGKITLPLTAHDEDRLGTFGMVTDKFGVEWTMRLISQS